MGYEIISAAPEAKAASERVLGLGVWPEQASLLVLPDTWLTGETGVTLWKGHRKQQGGNDGPWTFAYDWDCAVLIDDKIGGRAERYPLIFSWLMGHELSHALTAYHDPALYTAQLFVMYNIKQASGGAIQETVELRFEETCDRFGLGVCLGFGTQDDLQEEFKGAATDGIRVTDRDRVERLKRLEPLSELPDQEITWENRLSRTMINSSAS